MSDISTTDVVVDSLPYRKQTPPTPYKEFPKSLYDGLGNVCVATDKAHEESLRKRGFGDTPLPKPSASIEVRGQAQNGQEMRAMQEQAIKFDQAYSLLLSQYTALQAQHEALTEAHEKLKKSKRAQPTIRQAARPAPPTASETIA